MDNCNVIAIVNQKGGVGKTTTCGTLGIGLAKEGKKVLVLDCDPQASLTISLGYQQPDELPITLADILTRVVDDEPIQPKEGILHHEEGVDLMPSSIMLSILELSLVTALSREKVLKQYVDSIKQEYDYILIDCVPSLGMLTINVLVAAMSVIIPVQAQYLPIKGLELLLQTIGRVRRKLNPELRIEGILLTMVNNRMNLTKEISSLLNNTYGRTIKIYDTDIPLSVRAAETSAKGKSIYEHDSKGKVAEAYRELTKEVLSSGKDNKNEA